MILHLSPQSSWIEQFAASSALYAHITGGSLGLLSGATALAVKKGGPIHTWSGRVFLGSMLAVGLIGAAVAPLLPQHSSVVPGLLTAYLVVSGWATLRRPGQRGWELGAALTAALIAFIGCWLAGQAAAAPDGMLDNEPPSTYLFFAGIAAFAGALDIRALLRRQMSRAARLSRHLWRMCAALLLASVSFFLGQQQVLPAALRGSALLYVPELAVLTLLLFWLVRVRMRPAARSS